MSDFAKLKSYIQLATVLFSIFINFISILLVIFYSPAKLGNYKYLMIYFSIISIIYAILDFIVQPYIYSYGATFAMFMDTRDSVLENYPAVTFLLTSSLTGCFGLTVYSIAINFVYRFFALERQGRLKYFAGKKFVLWICIPIIFGVIWVVNNCIMLRPTPEMTEYLRYRIQEVYDLDIDKTSYTGCMYWRVDETGSLHLSIKDMLGALGLNQLLMIPFVTIVYFGSKSYKKIREIVSQGESEYSRKLQMQLYKALVAQTLIPMIFLFFPIGMIFTCPLIGVDFEWASVLITFLYSFYPVVDPLPTMIFVDNYRIVIINGFRRVLPGNSQISPVTPYEPSVEAA